MDIKCRFSGKVLFSFETDSIKICVEAAVEAGASLVGANLGSANLVGADLRGANLVGAKYGESIPIEHQPMQLQTNKYNVLVMDTHIKIGCKLYSHKEWEAFSDEEIAKMDGGALEWWNEWKGIVISTANAHQKRIAEGRA